jgi:protein-S-isoprenylcysteine O-methyltransferase Ste14
VLGQSLLLLAVIGSGLLWRREWTSQPVAFFGILLLLTAALCGIAGAASLGHNLTPFPKPRADAHLVQHGIYGLIRHPLYTAVFCGAVGWALLCASWPALIAALALAPFFDAKARHEERLLRQLFPDYSQYQQRVRRFIPWIY